MINKYAEKIANWTTELICKLSSTTMFLRTISQHFSKNNQLTVATCWLAGIEFALPLTAVCKQHILSVLSFAE